jgi:lipooligosaccharide transport system permease protein
MTAIALPSLRRSVRLVQRNLIVYKHAWMIVVSGFFEPVFYLLAIGIGLGSLVPGIDGIPFSAFVAPGLLAASCMNGAISDGFFNIFFKLHFQRTYEGILATPMRVADIACGEALWALTRGALYAAAFLLVVLALGAWTGEPMLRSSWAWLAWPAAVLVSGTFAAIALCITSFARRIEDFDVVMGLVVMPMFLFSGIFFPIARYPEVLQWVVQVIPLYHGVELLRQLTTGRVDGTLIVHVTYLAGVGAVALVVAMRRLERALVK